MTCPECARVRDERVAADHARVRAESERSDQLRRSARTKLTEEEFKQVWEDAHSDAEFLTFLANNPWYNMAEP